MKFLVNLKLEGTELKWPEVEVEAEDRWSALVGAVRSIGMADKASLSSFWKKSSIVKKEGKTTRTYRVESSSISGPELDTGGKKKWWIF